MKRYLLLTAVFLFGILGTAGAQTKSIVYTPFAISSTGTGSQVAYTAALDATIDSVWSYLKSNGTISGTEVYQARKIGTTGTLATYEKNQSALMPYKVANIIQGASVTASQTKVPLASGVTTIRDTVGIVDADTAAHDLIKFTVPANTWKDGQIMRLYATYYQSNDSNDGSSYLQSKITFSGDGDYTFDSSYANGPNKEILPLEFDFQRVGSDVYFAPAMYLVEKQDNYGLDGRSRTLNYASNDYFDNDHNPVGHGNGHKYLSVDFTHDITIAWRAQNISPAGHIYPNSIVKVIAGGVHVITLQ